MTWHFQECLENAEAYRWRSVKDYHSAWLQQLKQGRATWGDKSKKLKLMRALVWHKVAPISKPAADTATPSRQDTQAPGSKMRNGYYSQPSETVCWAFNLSNCMDNSSHPQELHMANTAWPPSISCVITQSSIAIKRGYL